MNPGLLSTSHKGKRGQAVIGSILLGKRSTRYGQVEADQQGVAMIWTACITGSNVGPCSCSKNTGEPSQTSYAYLRPYPCSQVTLTSEHFVPWRPPDGLRLPAVGDSTISKPSAALLPLIRRSWALSHECPAHVRPLCCATANSPDVLTDGHMTAPTTDAGSCCAMARAWSPQPASPDKICRQRR